MKQFHRTKIEVIIISDSNVGIHSVKDLKDILTDGKVMADCRVIEGRKIELNNNEYGNSLSMEEGYVFSE